MSKVLHSAGSPGVDRCSDQATGAFPRPQAALTAAVAADGPVDPARVRLALAALCDAAILAEQVGMIAAELYGRQSAGEALVLQVLGERIATLANCGCSLLDCPDDPLPELEKLVLSSRHEIDGEAA